MTVAIKFEQISKQYRLGLVSTRTLSHDLNRWWQVNILRREDPYLKIGETNDRATRGDSEYVWALRDINFSVEQGEVLGIIGKNGAGKSTLLKILSKVTAPTTGSIRARGRIASLLEVGTGFHPEMTGRENIFMNGAIMGMTKAEIRRKLDEIIDFAGVERYIDTPVKRYSSGMTVRLGFAVAAHLEPEILVVDEVLAVGDAEFQKKAIGKMQEVSKGEGRTVLFVSHNMAAVQSLCNRAILLENGQIIFSSAVSKTIEKYLTDSLAVNHSSILSRKDRSGTQQAKIEDLSVENLSSDGKILNDNPICIKVTYNCISEVPFPKFLISINSEYDETVLFFDSSVFETPKVIKGKGEVHLKTTDKFALGSGLYFINIALLSFDTMVDYIKYALSFTVQNGNFYNTGKFPSGHSICHIQQEWMFL